MDAKLVNPIIDAFMEVMPQMGFPVPKRRRVYLQDRNVISNGVTVTVGFTREMHGTVIYNMTMDTAKYIASMMMFGVPVNKFSDMAQSAVREMSNMLTARAAMNFSQASLEEIDITPPELQIGEDIAIKISDEKFLNVEMDLGGYKMGVALCIDQEV